ncbi:MAG: hypothetical protein ACK4Z5_08380 [Brevundimonas sp.]
MVWLRAAVAICAALVCLAPAARAQELERAEPGASAVCSIGFFVSDLYDINTREGRFGADAWAWSVCTGERDALRTAEYLNAHEQTQALDYTVETPFGLWSQRKVSGVYRQHFDVSNYPFDRHTLRIQIEDSWNDARTLHYVADDRRSTIREALTVDGWRITDYRVVASEATYNTAFGDPTAPDDARTLYPHLDVEIDIRRADLWTFWKLAAPLYIASTLTLLTFLMHDEEGLYLNPRLGLLSGVLFAVVLNMRAVDEVIGETSRLSLLDNIHLMALALAMFAIGVAAAWTVLTRRGWGSARVRRWDKRFFVATGALYVTSNALAIGLAVSAG